MPDEGASALAGGSAGRPDATECDTTTLPAHISFNEVAATAPRRRPIDCDRA